MLSEEVQRFLSVKISVNSENNIENTILILAICKNGLIWEKLFTRFTASALRKLLSSYVLSYFPFGFEVRMWDLIVSVPDHCLSFYLL